jgi:hypothetical protein
MDKISNSIVQYKNAQNQIISNVYRNHVKQYCPFKQPIPIVNNRIINGSNEISLHYFECDSTCPHFSLFEIEKKDDSKSADSPAVKKTVLHLSCGGKITHDIDEITMVEPNQKKKLTVG